MGMRREFGRAALAMAALWGGCGGSAEGTETGASTSGMDTDPTDPGTTTGDPSTTSTTTDASTTGTTSSMSGTSGDPPVCGDGTREDPEECDDGNNDGGDGCEGDCTLAVNTLLWEVTVGGGAGVPDRGEGITVDTAGYVYVVGFIVDEVSDSDIYVRKLDPGGDNVWTSILDVSSGRDDRGFGIAVDNDGNIAVTGSASLDEVETDIYLAKLDTNGVPVWSQTVNGGDPGVDAGHDVAVDSAGNLVFVGYVREGSNNNDMWIRKTDPDGVELWSRIIAGADNLDDRAEGVVIDGDDNIYIAGFVSNAGFNKDVYLRKYDPDGDDLWTTVFDSDLSGSEEAFDIALAPDGSIVVAGTTPITAANQDAWMGRFDASNGGLFWQRDFGGPAIEDDAANGVAVDADNNYILAGTKGIAGTDSDLWLRKYDESGGVVWTQNFAGAGAERDEILDVAVDADGNIVVCGEIRNQMNNDGDIWIAKLGPQ